MVEEVLLRYSGVEVQEIQHLPLHQVHLCQSKAKPFESFDRSVSSPVFVLGARVVQILRCQNQRRQEDAVHCASHALGDGRKSGAKAGKVDEGAHQGGNLDGRFVDQGTDELFE